LRLDKAVPHVRLQIVTRVPTTKKRNKSIVEKSSSDKRVRINEPTTKKDNQPDANVPIQTTTNQEETPLFDDEWERGGKEQPPDKGGATYRQQGYFYADGNVEWVVVKMIKRRTVTLCTRKKEKQVLVHWLYKNEKTWQRDAEVLPQLQVHYEDL
jgi:hypothetical protein